MDKQEFKILTRVLKEIRMYPNYARDIKTKSYKNLNGVKVNKRVTLANAIDYTLWWDRTHKGFAFWNNLNSYISGHTRGLKGSQDTMFKCIEHLKLHLGKEYIV